MTDKPKDYDGATEYIMLRIHDYAMASVQMHIAQRDTGECFDERKHQQAVWCAIRDMLNNEFTMLMDSCQEWAEKAEAASALLNTKLIVNEVAFELTDTHEPIPDCDCHSCALAERTRLQYEAVMLMTSMSDLLRHFTKTPSTLADSEARSAGHRAIERMRKVLEVRHD